MTNEVIPKPNIEELFTKTVMSFFDVECTEDKAGDLVCRFSFKSVRKHKRVEVSCIKISKDHLTNSAYVVAATQVGTDHLLTKVIK